MVNPVAWGLACAFFNYQKALMKPYADAGLASLGKASGHRLKPLQL